MTDRIRDRTLVMRVLPASLQSRLREKMKIAEDRAHRQHLHTSSQLLEDLDGVTVSLHNTRKSEPPVIPEICQVRHNSYRTAYNAYIIHPSLLPASSRTLFIVCACLAILRTISRFFQQKMDQLFSISNVMIRFIQVRFFLPAFSLKIRCLT